MKKSKQISLRESSNRKRGDRDEANIARVYGGTVVDGSGSTREKKGDVQFGKFLAQAKRTNRDSISVKLKDLDQIQDEALNRGKRPLFFLTFYAGETKKARWISMPEWMAEEHGIVQEE